MASEIEGMEPVEGAAGDFVAKAVEPETVGWARVHASLHFRSLLFSPTEREAPIAKQMEQVAEDLMRRMEPRDPAEEMMVAQMVWSYGRVAHLTRLATVQKNVKWATVYGEQADRAANLFRRQMLALAEYRRPKNRSFTAIKQANIAEQQVVTGGFLEKGGGMTG